MRVIILDDKVSLRRATNGSAGYDLMAAIDEPIILRPNVPMLIPLGVKLELDVGTAGMVLPRSGWGHKGLVLGNGIGLIDSDYRGQLMMSALNRSYEPMIIAPYDRIAQLVIITVVTPPVEVVASFDTQTARNDAGFGSTGA